MSGHGKKSRSLIKMRITFDTAVQIQLKVNFWIVLINTFRLIYNLFSSAEVQILPLFSVMTSFVIAGF